MLRYLIPSNWFFIVMALAITCYAAYNFTNSRSHSRFPTPAPATLIRYLSR